MKKMDAIGINIYGGGFTLGVLKHFNVLAQWEEITLGKKTFDLNFAGKIDRPLCNHDLWPVKQHKGRIPFVYANPPCAPWSSANTHLGKTKASRFEDQRLILTRHTYEAALALRPEVFISESVEAGYNIGASHYDQYVEMWMKAGYAVTFFLCDAILQGAPCMRRRFHFIAHRHALQLPSPPKLDHAVTVAETIADLEIIDGQVSLHELRPINPWILEVAKKTIPGEPLRKAINRVPNYAGPGIGFLVKRIKWDRPSFTMVGFNYIHPRQDRWITFREAMRLCTYPDTFMAHNAIEAVDAVLPVVGEFLAKVAKRTIEKSAYCKVQHRIIDWRPLAKHLHINSRAIP
jgi:DNA (cytosine-5)-methyltransferase 1